MSWGRIFALCALLPLIREARGSPCKRAVCRNIPGDPGWPSSTDWDLLNKTVDGHLIPTIPLASLCHGTEYDQGHCDGLKEAWPFAAVHVQESAEFLMPYFQNQSCDPYTAQEKPCELGNYAQYSINVSTVGHVQAGIKFARENNIRLTIKNTGHDIMDLLSGSELALLRQMPLKRRASRGFRVVTGTCPDVGVVGGYTPGGGHGIFTSIYGMGADNVLEWEVVTAKGEHLVATPTAHADLYWALSGGGAGTFAVVLSMVTRVYPDGDIAGASLSFDIESAGGVEKFWDGVATFQAAMGPVVDAGAVVAYALTPTAISVYGIAVPNENASAIDQVLSPITAAMSQVGIDLNITTTMHPRYLDFYNQYFLEAVTATPAAQITGGRLVPRSIMETDAGAQTVTEAFRNATDAGFAIVCDAINADQERLNRNAVFPSWRSSLLHCIFVKTWDFSMPWAEMTEYQANLTNIVMPQIEAVTPDGGAYLNEANFEQPDWQNVFYGENYPRLKGIKNQVDPQGIFYAQTAVGSERWAEDASGRLCQQ
ncbi:hypothetical protein EKO27_g8920 [Xylaria grammica]|uniref:FAD-binding PCMH-type domain-containing protein n=1 Tax=Xylaria grammica TaxID=363999 RepID=A0A439CVG7_9PEZI|nr:hypothetical protein EKO27_g8920 [Xylaria grammica]